MLANPKIHKNCILQGPRLSYLGAKLDSTRLYVYINNTKLETSTDGSIFSRYFNTLTNKHVALHLALVNYQGGLYGFFHFPAIFLKQAIAKGKNFLTDEEEKITKYLGRKNSSESCEIQITTINKNHIYYVAIKKNPVTGEELFRLSLDITYSETLNENKQIERSIIYSNPIFTISEAAKKLGLKADFEIPQDYLSQHNITTDRGVESTIHSVVINPYKLGIDLNDLSKLPEYDRAVILNLKKTYQIYLNRIKHLAKNIIQVINIVNLPDGNSFNEFNNLAIFEGDDDESTINLIAKRIKLQAPNLDFFKKFISHESSFLLLDKHSEASQKKYNFIVKILMRVALKNQLSSPDELENMLQAERIFQSINIDTVPTERNFIPFENLTVPKDNDANKIAELIKDKIKTKKLFFKILINFVSCKNTFVLNNSAEQKIKYDFILKILIEVTDKLKISLDEVEQAIPLNLQNTATVSNDEWFQKKLANLKAIEDLAKFKPEIHLVRSAKLNKEKAQLIGEKISLNNDIARIDAQITEHLSAEIDFLTSKRNLLLPRNFFLQNKDASVVFNSTKGELTPRTGKSFEDEMLRLKQKYPKAKDFNREYKQLGTNSDSRLKNLNRLIQRKTAELNTLQQKYPNYIPANLLITSAEQFHSSQKALANLQQQKGNQQVELAKLEAQINEKTTQIIPHSAAYYENDPNYANGLAVIQKSVDKAKEEITAIKEEYRQFKIANKIDVNENFSDTFRSYINDKHSKYLNVAKGKYLSVLKELTCSPQTTEAERQEVDDIFAAAKVEEIINTHVDNFNPLRFFGKQSSSKIDVNTEETKLHQIRQVRMA